MHPQPAPARGVLTTRRAPRVGKHDPVSVGDAVTEYDYKPGLARITSHGVTVIAVTGEDVQSLFKPAIELAVSLRAHPLDLIAIALPPKATVSPATANTLASRGIVLLLSTDGSAVGRAEQYIASLKVAHQQATDHLSKFAQAVQDRADTI